MVILTQSDGTAVFPLVQAGGGYVVQIIMDGYGGIRQEAEVADGSIKDCVIALAPEHVERVIVMADKANVSGISAGDPLTGTFLNLASSDSIEDLTVVTAGAGAVFGRAAGGFAQIVQSVRPPSEFGASPDDLEPRAARARLRELAFRVLADLSDDGKLTTAGGKPALAALLGTQLQDGTIAEDVSTHAVATWALIEAATAMPNDAWIATARDKAVDLLAALASPAGWPRSDGGKADVEATRWARLALGKIRPDVVSGVPVPQRAPSEEYARLRDAIVAKRPGVLKGNLGAFDRLVATIGRGRLKSFLLSL
jgi:hypothetical protein